MEPAVGSTGNLSVLGSNASYGSAVGGLGGQIAVGWFANTTWRLDFDIGSSATDDFVERFEVANTGIDEIAVEDADLDRAGRVVCAGRQARVARAGRRHQQ